MTMRCEQRVEQMLYGCAAAFLTVLLALSAFGQPETSANGIRASLKPRITITRVPPKGGGPDIMETIAGTAGGVDLKQVRVVLFARTNTWYVQPYAASPYTPVGDDGKWETKTHLGDEYAALLVEASYTPPATTDTLPEVAGPVLAIARVAAKAQVGGESATLPGKVPSKHETRLRRIKFSGYEWTVKSSSDRVGPGPNYFSDSRSNVAIDSRGRLHLRITKRDGRWYCAEVVSAKSFGYGTYRFYVNTRVDDIDPKIVLGMFTWSDEPAYSHREIDVEMARWGDSNNKNAQFVVQPYTHPSNIVSFQIPPELNRTTHLFRWQSDSVFCQSLKGFYTRPRDQQSVIYEHTFTQDIPKPGGENARINLWLMSEKPPANGSEMEIIISKFEFLPSK